MDPAERPPAEAVEHAELERDDAVIGKALRWSLAVIVVLAAGISGAVYWTSRAPAVAAAPAPPLDAVEKRAAVQERIPRIEFKDITREAGIEWVHENGAYGEKLLPETMGGGCAFFDFDNDGHQDLLLINSSHWPWREDAAARPATTALYRNDGQGNFTDVSAECGLDVTCYGMGVAVGDYDGDGWVDVFISAVGKNKLFRNVGGKFEDVTDAAGAAGGEGDWSTSCCFFDYDNDGDLDLFVCNYLQWTREIDVGLSCTLTGHGRAYCRPDAFAGTFPFLYRNDGQGRFTDVSASAGVQITNSLTGVPLAKSLGVVPIDLDNDGWIDLVVANDTVQNLVFRNLGNGTFEELGAPIAVAYDSNGNARGAMGIDAACFRNDDTIGLVIGNFANEMTALYVSRLGAMQFSDDAIATGLGPPSRLMLKFGLFFFDYDLDTRLDIFTANGHLEEDIHKVQASQHYEQPPHLFRNFGPEADSEFVLVPPEYSGDDFSRPMVGRGATYADIDGDGDLDVLVTAIGSPPRLLRNEQKLGHHWLRVKLIGTSTNRDAIGAWVEAHLGSKVMSRQVMPTRSYLSQVELPVTFGLGDASRIDRLRVRWPDGSVQEVPDVPGNQMLVVKQATEVK
ncbi:MAG: CRTAC1 family protein [Pirellulales bacterium]